VSGVVCQQNPGWILPKRDVILVGMEILDRRGRVAVLLSCPLLIALIGYGDYLEGAENSMLLFYLVPIGLATWYSGTLLGLGMALLSVATDLIADAIAGVPQGGAWDLLTNSIYFVVFIFLLSRCRQLIETMRARIDERTAELRREIMARKTLERKIAQAADRERRQIGQELHDGLCQHLTGTALKARMVASALQRQHNDAMEEAGQIVSLLNGGIKIARDIARGLFSSELEGEGLVSALDMLAESVSREYGIQCQFINNTSASIPLDRSTQLYWIAREAVNNAITHAAPSRIVIRLQNSGENISLSILDDGPGMRKVDDASGGIGLHVMARRAEVAGGQLVIGRSELGGALVSCKINTNGSSL
jgi:signal transduction histidine kinase